MTRLRSRGCSRGARKAARHGHTHPRTHARTHARTLCARDESGHASERERETESEKDDVGGSKREWYAQTRNKKRPGVEATHQIRRQWRENSWGPTAILAPSSDDTFRGSGEGADRAHCASRRHSVARLFRRDARDRLSVSRVREARPVTPTLERAPSPFALYAVNVAASER